MSPDALNHVNRILRLKEISTQAQIINGAVVVRVSSAER